MDRRTILALALALLVFIFFQAMNAKYAPRRPLRPHADSLQARARGPAAGPGDSAAAAEAESDTTGTFLLASRAPVAAREYVLETPLYRATFSTLGARMTGFELKQFAAAHGSRQYEEHPNLLPRRGAEVPPGDRVELGGAPTFALDLGSGAHRVPLQTLAYAASESAGAGGAASALTFVARDSSGLMVRQTWRVRPGSYLLDLEVETRSVPAAWKLTDLALVVRSWPLMTEANPQNDLRSLRAVSLVGRDLHRDGAAGLVGKDPKLHEGVAHWAGVQSHYFVGLVGTLSGEGRSATGAGSERTLSAAQLSRLPAGTKPAQPVAEGTLLMPLPPGGDGVRRFVAYFGPADYFALAREGGPLGFERAVDMGWNWIVPVSKLLLAILRWLNSVVHNYGVTILLLATLARLVLHPLNMSSMKSMRAMQRLQPEIERLRAKFKNDATAQNTALMALYRENGVNPAGGCLPMFLQMPLFFALYAVIFNAIDLRQAPFFGWIHDLSAPDTLFTVAGFPVRFLPVLMAGTGFLSQRFAPTDPRQAPTMYMMNIVMLGIFYPMPSGLVFYWTVMNVLTALQQWLAIRGDGGSGAVVVTEPLPAGKGRKT